MSEIHSYDTANQYHHGSSALEDLFRAFSAFRPNCYVEVPAS